MVEVDLGFCPRCGGPLERCEGNQSHRSCCSLCGFYTYHNPFPVVVATVVDGDSALFVKRARAPDRGCWSMPGGYMEMDEAPEAGAARELFEETGLEVDPKDLTFVGTAYERIDDRRGAVDIIFATPIEKVHGQLRPGDDAADGRFWRRDEIAANPPELRAGDPTPILWAIDHLGKPKRSPGIPLW